MWKVKIEPFLKIRMDPRQEIKSFINTPKCYKKAEIEFLIDYVIKRENEKMSVENNRELGGLINVLSRECFQERYESKRWYHG
jgi:hypothetical protein